MDYDTLLIKIASIGGVGTKVRITSTEIANAIGKSQQSASRILIDLEKEGLINRQPCNRGINVSLTNKGISHLRQKHYQLKAIFEKKETRIKGIVKTGLGEGSYYIRKSGYYSQFREKLMLTPFLGTLNLEVTPEALHIIKSNPIIKIEGFKDSSRSFGHIDCYQCKIRSSRAYIIFPERSSHAENIIEIISDVNFRNKYSLNDEDIVEVLL